MPVDNYPSIQASAEHRTVTLAELRELVDAAALLPPDTIVRGNMIFGKFSDLGNRKGSCITSIALDQPERPRS